MSAVELRQYLARLANEDPDVDRDFLLDRWLDSQRLGDDWSARQLEVMRICEMLDPPPAA